MFIRCLYRLPGVLRFIARSGNHIVTSLHVDKNGLFNFFQAEKRQQMRQAAQRWTAFFRGESGFRGQQHHSLGITTGLVRRNNLLFIATLLHYRVLVYVTVYDQPGRSLRVLFINFVRTDWPDHSHCNENFTFNQTIQSGILSQTLKLIKSILFLVGTAGTSS